MSNIFAHLSFIFICFIILLESVHVLSFVHNSKTILTTDRFISFRRHCQRTSGEYSDPILMDDLVKACVQCEKLKFHELFRTLANHPSFLESYWQAKPFLCTASLQNVDGSFTMEDVKEHVEKDFLEAGRGTFEEGKGGWNMATVSQPRGRTFEDAKLRYEDVQMAMKAKSGTVVFNSAGGFIPPLADVCLQCVTAFDLPAALNMYLTAAGQQTSAPPHTDKQEVFALQTQGQKRWRVFAPPPPSRMPRADPYARGKAADELDIRELQDPVLDIVLSPGQMLYCPSGWPHTTDTVTRVSTEDPSVHLTVGVDTHIWRLSYSALREAVLAKNNMKDKITATKLKDEVYWSLQDCLPVGFLQSPMRSMSAGLASRLRAVEPSRWESEQTAEELAAALGVEEVEMKFRMHHRRVTDIFRKMYADVAFKMTPVQMDLSFFRSKPYFDELETYMGEFLSSISKPDKKKKRVKT